MVAPSSVLWVLASACLPLDCGGLCCALSGELDSSGLDPFSLGSLGGHPGRGCGRAGVGHRDSGDSPPHASGWVLVQLVFQSVGSFLVGGDDWGGLSFPYWVFLPPA